MSNTVHYLIGGKVGHVPRVLSLKFVEEIIDLAGWLPVCHSRASELSGSGTALRQAQGRLCPGCRLDRLESRSHYRNPGFRDLSRGSHARG